LTTADVAWIDPAGLRRREVESVVLHEAAHAAGLEHGDFDAMGLLSDGLRRAERTMSAREFIFAHLGESTAAEFWRD
jgi:hypothetical protein